MLSISDVGLFLSLGLFLFSVHEIHAAACFAQEFFIHLFTVTEASVLSVMAFDRYMAIHNPLRYSTILTSSQDIKTGVLLTLKKCPFDPSTALSVATADILSSKPALTLLLSPPGCHETGLL